MTLSGTDPPGSGPNANKRATAGALAHGGYLAINAVLDRIRQNAASAPELAVLPDKLDTLRHINGDSGTIR